MTSVTEPAACHIAGNVKLREARQMNFFRKIEWDFYFIAIVLVSGFMNLFLLTAAGTNEFYTVAVKSMMKNFHNFFFASFDPAGFITVDKPPVALWLQVLSAKIFGLSNFSVLLPSAVAAVVSTALLYVMVKKKAGTIAAFIAGLAMAFTPIFVAVSRTNNVDGVLILTLVLAAWAIFKAEESGRLRWLFVSVIFIGIGFNTKMLEAYMILPAVYLFYFLAIKKSWRKKLLHLAAATVILAAVSFSWSLAVDAIPASERPFVGSSTTNSELELAFGYNGVSRLTGQHSGSGNTGMERFGEGMTQPGEGSQNGGQMSGEENTNSGGGMGAAPPGFGQASGGTAEQNGNGMTPPGSQQDGRENRGGGMFGTGTAGPLRLFSKELSGQASWLLPFVLFGIIAVAVDLIRRRRLNEQHTFSIFWLAWLLPAMIFFSIAGFFHQYYLSFLAPPIAALTGIGASFMIREFMRGEGRSWLSFLLPVAFSATLLFEALIFYQNNVNEIWIFLLFAAAVLVLAFGLLWRTGTQKRMKGTIIGASLAAMLAPTVYWSMPSVLNQTNSSIPAAGPSSSQSGMGMGGGAPGGMQMSGNNQRPSGFPDSSSSGSSEYGQASARMNGSRQNGGENQMNTKLLSYLRKNYDGEKFILAVPSAQSAYDIMMKTNYAVMAMGGFEGNDPALTVSKLEKMVKNGEIKYFLLSGNRGNTDVTNWIKKHCSVVPESEWSDTSSGQSSGFGGMNGGSTLYVYKGK